MKILSNLSGFSSDDWAVNSSINNGYPYLLSLEETYKTYTVTAIDDPENSAAVSRSFAHVGGVLFSGAGKTASSGGIIGSGSGASGASSDAVNLLTVSDKISSLSSGSGYIANSGDIVGANSNGAFKFSSVYSYSETELDAVNSANSANAAKNTISETRPANQLTRTAFLKPVFGPDAYQSLDYLGEHPDAVWVIREGELPELYHTMLRDITLSEVENGEISVDKPRAVDGEIVTVTAAANEGYVLNKIYVNGAEIVGSTFELDGDSDVYATFSGETPEYKVSVAFEFLLSFFLPLLVC